MSKQLINQYYNQRDNLKRVGVTNEMAIKQPFDNLLLNLASAKHYVYATEVTIKNENGKNVRPDGILMNELRIHKGYVESKDTNDTLDEEINKKLYKDGYPKTNIIFQDSIFAVLFQNGVEISRIEMADADKLEKILNQFINYKPDYIEKFDEALHKFKEDIPTIVETLRNTISEEFKTNKKFVTASEDFFEMCQKEINPQITKDDIREMIIQHILTEDLFKSVFDESDFHHENNIASQLESLVNTFMSRSVRQNQLGELGHYYKTLNAQAALVSDHHEKQKFLKVVYENFYKVYNPKGADKLGVVYTPNEIVRFMVKSTDYLLQKHFNKGLADKNVHILDPATGTGTFITDIIDYIPSQYIEHKYKHEIFANEVAILPYYVANLNIEYTYKQKMGKYLEFPNSCFVDTLDNIDGLAYDGKQHNMFGFSSENAERIKRQNEQKISVIIGNPPYNANQANFNDFNKNREYKNVDDRIKQTYIKYSNAQKTKVYDPFARFYRWASDRVDVNGIIAFVTNNAFVHKKTFDGFRKSIELEFDFCYIIDLGGDVREISGKDGISIGEEHTVFGLGAMVGIAIMFLVKTKEKLNDKCQIKYIHPCDIRATRIEKFEWLSAIQSFNQIAFEAINPDKNNNWINKQENDFDDLLPLLEKKSKNVLFQLSSLGVSTNRDSWVIDIDKKDLSNKAKFLSDTFNSSVSKNNIDEDIKWSRDLKNKFDRKLKSKFDKNKIVNIDFRPYSKYYYYSEKIFSDVLTQNHFDFFGQNLSYENKLICVVIEPQIPFVTLSTKSIINMHYGGRQTQIFAQFRYDQEGNRHDNITDWGLSQFTSHYQNTKITKEDIFYYTYAVLHNPEYRKKYELNLKREFPRLPFYDNFFKWVSWGKQLMELHINYETVAPFELQVIDNTNIVKDKNYKLKVKLKADKAQGVIAIDEHTHILGVPESAWLYKLGNRSALEWVLDQYKEKKYTDKTIAEKFNTYRFADYKNHVIDLLKKVCTVSVETMKIIEEMNK
ncbi:MAG: DNA methyltransferase [Flavobacterium sp.]|jgi:predicted helicase|uniref:type ISP restriction/modification enzyme n=1 Tax=Flavobacterium sp. TaxID=239 RepID=UPI0022C7459D|nr:type ISP restriction/modification enzyme [Flavobacterium sp.]MCZ8330117.1 DNA methyltransferase [Flavobacterium sp.]